MGPLLALLFFPSLAWSHDGLHRESLRALLKPGEFHLTLLWSRAAGDRARLEREKADLNKDGHLDRAERQRWLDVLEKSIGQRLSLRLDGALLSARTEQRGLTGMRGPSKSSEAISASLHLAWSFGTAEKGHELRLRFLPRNLSGHVPLLLQQDSRIELLEHSGRQRRVAGRKILEDVLSGKKACRLRFVSTPAKKAPEDHL